MSDQQPEETTEANERFDEPAARDLDGSVARKRLYAVMHTDDPFEGKAERAMAIGRAYLDVDHGHLTRIDPEGDYWRVVASTDPPEGRFPVGATGSLAQTYCRRTIEEATSNALHDAENQGWADDPAYTEHGVACYHGTPLRVEGDLYGTICFASSDPRAERFSEAETTFAELIARLLEAELSHERTAAKIERIDEFASVVSHDLRNPLNVAQGRIDLERESNDTRNLRTAARALDRMEGLIADVLEMAREGQDVDDTDLRTVRLADVVDDCWRSVVTADAAVEVVDDVRFRAVPGRVERIFENCFRNAIEHGGDDVTVRVGALPRNDGFYVEDDGPGIPETDRAHVFEGGFSTGSGGAGLGLSIVKGVAEAHGWEVAVAKSGSGGARFEVSGVIVVED